MNGGAACHGAPNGPLAHLVEHLFCTQEARSSSLRWSTQRHIAQLGQGACFGSRQWVFDSLHPDHGSLAEMD